MEEILHQFVRSLSCWSLYLQRLLLDPYWDVHGNYWLDYNPYRLFTSRE